jgi:hypothetical protein
VSSMDKVRPARPPPIIAMDGFCGLDMPNWKATGSRCLVGRGKVVAPSVYLQGTSQVEKLTTKQLLANRERGQDEIDV